MKTFRDILVSILAVVAIFFVSGFLNMQTVLAGDKVDINTADATELDTIPEVGPSTAAKIIAYREANGPFLVIEDIMKVSGIKEATFAKMKDFITVGGDSDEAGGDEDEVENETGTTTATTTVTVATTTPTTTNTTQISSHSSGPVSIHYVQESLSDYEDVIGAFEISAGRERVSYVGSPVAFEAKSKISDSLKHKKPDCFWSFGDGSSANTEKVTHIYKYPGEYNVVLNGTLDDLNSVSRTKVKVLTPNLFLQALPGGAVEILNKSPSEINLYNWKLQSGNETYAFPLDTIISVGKSVIFPAEFLKLNFSNKEVILVDASGQIINRTGVSLQTAGSEPAISLAELEKFILAYKQVSPQPSVVPSKPSKENNISLVATVANVIIDETKTSTGGFWAKVFHPIKTIKETFYR